MNDPNPSQQPENQPLAQTIKKMLGLPDTATDDEIVQALEKALKALPDPEKYVPIEAMKSAMDDRAEKASAQAEMRTQAKVQAAMREGYITPGMAGWATALCAQNEASFDAFLAGMPARFEHLAKPSHATGSPPPFARSLAVERQGDAAAVCRQLGLKEDALG